MRTETNRPITPKRAPHRRFFPVVGSHVTGLPGEQSGPRLCIPANRKRVVVDCCRFSGRCFSLESWSSSSRRTGSRAGPFWPWRGWLWLRCRFTTWPPIDSRSTYFVAASIAGLFWVFDSEGAAIVLGLSAVLIGICFLPISWTARALGLAVLAGIFAYVRSHATVPLVPGTVWPVLATMFMFRMMIYHV